MSQKIIVSIILPTYNEDKSILVLITRIINVFSSLKQNYQPEIIIVDDNSPDKTAYLVLKKYRLDKRIKVFIRKRVKGLGTAIGFGIKQSTGKIIIGMDADGNHTPEIIPFMLNKLKNNDLVVGSRFIKGGGGEDWQRQYASLIFNFVLKYFLGFPIWDNTSGFYAIKKKDLIRIGLDKIYYGYGDYHLRLVYLAKLCHYQLTEIPVYYQKRLGGQSKSILLKMVIIYFWEAIKLKFNFLGGNNLQSF